MRHGSESFANLYCSGRSRRLRDSTDECIIYNNANKDSVLKYPPPPGAQNSLIREGQIVQINVVGLLFVISIHLIVDSDAVPAGR